jgi:DNA-binding FrmR family transcriptional regulator
MIYAHTHQKKTKAEDSIAKKEIDHDRDKLVTRARRIRGQIEAVERALINEEEDCADTLQLLAACRGAINSLMAEVMEGHIREHIGRGRASEEVTDDLLAIVRAYLK